MSGEATCCFGGSHYYGAFYRSELRFLAWHIDEHLARWVMHKFKRFRGKDVKAMAWLQKVYQHPPLLFTTGSSSRSLPAGLWGRMTGDRHVRS